MDAETRKAAIDTIARHALVSEITYAVASGQIGWGDYPELDEADFSVVLARVQAIAASIAPTAEQYQAAYDHLTPTVQEGPAA